MPNFQSYPHTSLEEACKLVPSVNVTDTVNFSLNRLKKFVLPLFCSQEDPSRVLPLKKRTKMLLLPLEIVKKPPIHVLIS